MQMVKLWIQFESRLFSLLPGRCDSLVIVCVELVGDWFNGSAGINPSLMRFFCFIRRFWNQILTWKKNSHQLSKCPHSVSSGTFMQFKIIWASKTDPFKWIQFVHSLVSRSIVAHWQFQCVALSSNIYWNGILFLAQLIACS